MDILVATTAGSFWGPQAHGIAQTMRQQGCSADVVTRSLVAGNEPLSCDLLLCIGSGESLTPFLSRISARVKVLYLLESVPTLTESDEFTQFKVNVHRPYLNQFDQVFVHTVRSVPFLKSIGMHLVEPLIWPHFPEIFQPASGVAQDIDVLFLGTLSPYRQWILYKIGTRFRATTASGVFHKATGPLLARAKIVLNIHFTPLRNLECRVIEVLGCGAFLMTQELDPDDVFLDGKHLAVFDESNVLDQVGHYLERTERRAEIGQAGHDAVQGYHVERQVDRILGAARRLLSDRPQ